MFATSVNLRKEVLFDIFHSYSFYSFEQNSYHLTLQQKEEIVLCGSDGVNESMSSVASLPLQIDPLWPPPCFIDSFEIVNVYSCVISANLSGFNVIVSKFVVAGAVGHVQRPFIPMILVILLDMICLGLILIYEITRVPSGRVV